MKRKNRFIRYLFEIFAKESAWTKFYLCVRVYLIPNSFFTYLETLAATYKSLLDIGCGYGIITLYLKYLGYQWDIYWLDIDAKRINMLNDIKQQHWWTNVVFDVRDFIKEWFTWLEWYEVWILVDILHHLDKATQDKLIDHVWKKINAIVIKDIDIKPRAKYYWNYFHDKVLMRNEILCFQWSRHMQKLLEQAWYTTTLSFPRSVFPYPHYLLIWNK
jgi:2-polyprenyl-3-methyl-5-hydroxy-6-metoxy-1,4-benzoquinol methylase